MTEQEIVARLAELRKPIEDRSMEISQLKRELMKLQQEKLKPLVGMCFKTDKTVFMISDIPEPDMMKTGDFMFNPYHIPAIVVVTKGGRINRYAAADSVGEICYDEIHSMAADSDDPVKEMRSKYTQISPVEFRELAIKALDEAIRTVGYIGKFEGTPVYKED